MADSWQRVSREYRAAGILPYSFDSDGRLLFLFQAEASKKKARARNGVRGNVQRGKGAGGDGAVAERLRRGESEERVEHEREEPEREEPEREEREREEREREEREREEREREERELQGIVEEERSSGGAEDAAGGADGAVGGVGSDGSDSRVNARGGGDGGAEGDGARSGDEGARRLTCVEARCGEGGSCAGGGGNAQGCSSAPRGREADEMIGARKEEERGCEGKDEGSGRGVAEVEGGRRNECGDAGRRGAEKSGRGGEGGRRNRRRERRKKGERTGEKGTGVEDGTQGNGREESDERESELEDGTEKGEQQGNGKQRKEEQGAGQQGKEEQGKGKKGVGDQGTGQQVKEQQAREERRRRKQQARELKAENRRQQRERQKQQKQERRNRKPDQQKQQQLQQRGRVGPVYLMDFGGKIEDQDSHAPTLTAAREYVEELEAGCEKLEGAMWQKRVTDVAAALDQSEAFYCKASKYVLFLCDERSLRDGSKDVTLGSFGRVAMLHRYLNQLTITGEGFTTSACKLKLVLTALSQPH
ncbi:unnamed protein product [Closterium sp. NIES-65]|nr:unnamed protein product [Closterium sp. NIES-65]